jgi:hypothetical protein
MKQQCFDEHAAAQGPRSVNKAMHGRGWGPLHKPRAICSSQGASQLRVAGRLSVAQRSRW